MLLVLALQMAAQGAASCGASACDTAGASVAIKTASAASQAVSIRAGRLERIGLILEPGQRFTLVLATYRLRTHRSSTVSLGHCTSSTFFFIAQFSVRRYSGT